ncbi:MAG: hypothetical protein SVU32_00365 [Candidatus Nanohaloarchaea archaeon]|nr:hypothetical protein [Candidatus Nanohaloarchaea archaeon]
MPLPHRRIIGGLIIVVLLAGSFVLLTGRQQDRRLDPGIEHRFGNTTDQEAATLRTADRQGIVAHRNLPDNISRDRTYNVTISIMTGKSFSKDRITITERFPSYLATDRQPPLTFAITSQQHTRQYQVSYQIHIPRNTSRLEAPRFNGTVTAGGRAYRIGGEERLQ